MKHKNFVSGEWVDGDSYYEKLNPCNLKLLGEFPKTNKESVNQAVEIAEKSFHEWKKTSRLWRGELFDNLAQLIKRDHKKIVSAISLETGKSLNESHAETIEALHMVQFTFGKAREATGKVFASEIPGKRIRQITKPRGVVGVITPWNFPFAIPFWTSAPALLEGNTVVFKPSEDTPMCAELIAKLMEEAGFPAGTFNMVHGVGCTGAAVVDHPSVKTILFTGSAEVGDQIQQKCYGGKICSCEMGSKSAVIVNADADMDIAIEGSIPSFSKLSGQRCVSSSRLIVHEDVIDEFVKRFVSEASQLVVGDPFENEAINFGPLINQAQADKVRSYNVLVRNDVQAEVLVDKENLGLGPCYVGPFVYKTKWRDAPYLKQEVFGPHVAIIPFSTVEEACEIYNDTDFALAVGIVTECQRTQAIFEQECDAGMIYFNSGSIAAESHLTFGGDKRSGNNRPSAAGTFDTVVNKVSVTENLNKSVMFPQGMK